MAGSRDALERTVEAVKSQFSFHCPEVVAEWERFRDFIAPQDDDAERYRRDHGMHIPFAVELFGDIHAGDRGDLAPLAQNAPAARDVTFTGSMKWSGRRARRERVSNVPYVANRDASPPREARAADVETPVRNRRKRRQERSPSTASSSSSSSDEPEYEYIEFDITDSNARDYVKYIGRIFDDDDDGGTYQILAICDMRKVGGRRSTNIVHAFKYITVDGHADDYLYTPVREMLNSYWCKWRPAPQVRSARVSTTTDAVPAADASSSSSGSSNVRRSSRTGLNR